jgi:hypothetical protein
LRGSQAGVTLNILAQSPEGVVELGKSCFIKKEKTHEALASGEGAVNHPGLVLHLRETAVFCQMLTGRFNIPIGLISGNTKLRGDLRLFLRMDTLFSVDAPGPQLPLARNHQRLPNP